MTSAVLFHIDGTLVDSTYHHAVAWHRAFSRIGDVPTMWRIHRAIGMGGDRLVAEVAGQEVEDHHGDEARDAWREEYLALRAEVGALPGAARLVKLLAQAGFVVALASSGDPQFAHESVELLDIGSEVATLVTSADVESSKPHPDLVDEILRRLGHVDRSVFVGDTVYDVQAAGRAGLPCVGVLSGGYGRAELTDAGAVLVAGSTADLCEADWASMTA